MHTRHKISYYDLRSSEDSLHLTHIPVNGETSGYKFSIGYHISLLG